MRVAALYDVRGNLPALDAVLEEVEEAGADLIVVGGDVAGGPMPAQTLDRLAMLGERVRWVRGNADRELVEAYDAGADQARASVDFFGHRPSTSTVGEARARGPAAAAAAWSARRLAPASRLACRVRADPQAGRRAVLPRLAPKRRRDPHSHHARVAEYFERRAADS